MLDVILIILLLFQGTLVNISSYFDYLDETVLFILILRAFYKVVIKKEKTQFSNYEKLAFYFIIIFYCFGIFSDLYNNIQNNHFNSAISGILTIKPLIVYFVARISMTNIKIRKRFLNGFFIFINITLTIYFLILLLNIRFDFLQIYDIRYGIKTVSIGFSHVSELDFFATSLMVILLFLTLILNKNIKVYILKCIPIFFLILFSGRSKSLAFYVLFMLFIFIITFFKKFNFKSIVLFIPLAIYLGLSRIKLTILDTTSARGALYVTSFKISKDYFPLGTGFGTFGTFFSVKNYSPLYYNYGISNIWGLRPDMYAFAMDTHWPPILAETGAFGLVVYMIIMVLLFIHLFHVNENLLYKLSIVSLFLYGIISSVAESIFMSHKGVAIFVITSFFISVMTKKNKQVNKTKGDLEDE